MITLRVPSTKSVLSIVLFASSVRCHMEMSWPYPLRSIFNPENNYNNIDYSMTSPLNSDGSNFPCKGYQNDRPIQPVVTYQAGSTYNMTLAGSAMHGGGSCQLSLSYDNGATFQVIESMIGGCPMTSTYNFTVPINVPSGTVLFAWTWQNLIGNREYYMNCAEVAIVSNYGTRQGRGLSTSLSELPLLWKANLVAVNNCTTGLNETVVYPQPGPQVVYGAGFSNASKPTPGDCNAATPYGQMYESLPGSTPPLFGSSVSNTSSTNSSNSYSNSSSRSPSETPYSLEPVSTTTITVDCLPTLTLTTMPSSYITTAPSAACTGTSASCPCAANYQCLELSPCVWGCEAYAISTARSRVSKTRLSMTISVRPVRTSARGSAMTFHPDSPSSPPPYAGSNVNHYLPCVPGTFICTDLITWDTCDSNVNGHWSYQYPRKVAAGMECLPFLAPNSGLSSQQIQQGSTPRGYYRDDRIVRARPNGSCTQNGAIRCTQNDQMFEVCDQGGWVEMGAVALGTRCENGQITSFL